jgi:uncharacterized FlaG/YvyC family protein
MTIDPGNSRSTGLGRSGKPKGTHMNDTSINPISGLPQSESIMPTKTPAPAQAETVAQAQAIAVRLEKNQFDGKNQSSEAGTPANVSIHFRVDEKTNEVTVFLVDRKSKKVLRSIPADELQKLQVGDLLQLTA